MRPLKKVFFPCGGLSGSRRQPTKRAAGVEGFAIAGLLALAAASCAAPAVAGPVGIGPDRRSFVDGAGRPAFWLGDTQWELFLAFKEEEAEAILE